MPSPVNNYFFDTICHLRRREEIVIYNRYAPVLSTTQESVITFLRQEYEKECLEFPADAPDFNGGAAFWSARTVYIASQLLLYREKTGEETVQLLPVFDGLATPGAILSADLCLRFLPDVLSKAKDISPDDSLIPLLERHLHEWHFSGIGYPLDKERLDWQAVADNDCLQKLYIDRVIQRRWLPLAGVPALQSGIRAAIGDHGTFYWKEYINEYESD